jgi:hypothetical protein
MTLVREQRAAIPMTTPVDEILDRGRALRTKNRIPRVAGALAVTAGAAVARQPDGDVTTGSSYAGFHAIGGREVHVSVVRGSKYCPLS